MEPAVTSIPPSEATHLGMDVHKDWISVGVLEPGRETAAVDKIFNDEPSIRRLMQRFPDRGRLRACYRPGPRATSCTGCSPAWAWPVR